MINGQGGVGWFDHERLIRYGAAICRQNTAAISNGGQRLPTFDLQFFAFFANCSASPTCKKILQVRLVAGNFLILSSTEFDDSLIQPTVADFATVHRPFSWRQENGLAGTGGTPRSRFRHLPTVSSPPGVTLASVRGRDFVRAALSVSLNGYLPRDRGADLPPSR